MATSWSTPSMRWRIRSPSAVDWTCTSLALCFSASRSMRLTSWITGASLAKALRSSSMAPFPSPPPSVVARSSRGVTSALGSADRTAAWISAAGASTRVSGCPSARRSSSSTVASRAPPTATRSRPSGPRSRGRTQCSSMYSGDRRWANGPTAASLSSRAVRRGASPDEGPSSPGGFTGRSSVLRSPPAPSRCRGAGPRQRPCRPGHARTGTRRPRRS